MPPSRFTLCIIAALSLGGCTLAAQVAGSSIIAGDQRGGTVSRVTTFTNTGALNTANAWCGQYNLVAQETRVMFITDSMEFACTLPPV